MNGYGDCVDVNYGALVCYLSGRLLLLLYPQTPQVLKERVVFFLRKIQFQIKKTTYSILVFTESP
jgi:hypothetical protein